MSMLGQRPRKIVGLEEAEWSPNSMNTPPLQVVSDYKKWSATINTHAGFYPVQGFSGLESGTDLTERWLVALSPNADLTANARTGDHPSLCLAACVE